MQCKMRDQAELQKLIDQQLRERRHLQHDFRLLRHQHGIQTKKLNRDIGEYSKLTQNNGERSALGDKLVARRRRQIRGDL